ncbi:hypothetical protein D6C76_09530 [Aureobasidium pullulans]|nr:hypothetical protein D6C76_09530 [Aureobasidium pullulans]
MVSDSAPSGASESPHKAKDGIAPSKGYILTLPTELLAMTLENLKQKELGMVRRTCKTLCNVATLPFARKMPTVRRFRFVEEDMDRLVRLTAHPVFALTLQTILFSTCRLLKVETSQLRADYDKISRIRILQQAESFACRKKQLNDVVCQAENHNMSQETQATFFIRGLHIKAPVQALQNLMMHGNDGITLGLYDHGDLTKYMAENPGHVLAPGGTDDVASTLQILGTVIELSKYPVKTLKLDLREDDIGCHDIANFEMFWQKMQHVPDVLVTLTCSGETSVTQISRNKSRVVMIGHSLQDARKDAEAYDQKPSYYNSRYSDLWTCIARNPHHDLVMRDVDADYHILESFLCCKTIHYLSLQECYLSQTPEEYTYEDGSPNSNGVTLCQELTKLVNLETLVLGGIYDSGNSKWIQKSLVRWTGQEQIHAGLHKLAARMSGWEWED